MEKFSKVFKSFIKLTNKLIKISRTIKTQERIQKDGGQENKMHQANLESKIVMNQL